MELPFLGLDCDLSGSGSYGFVISVSLSSIHILLSWLPDTYIVISECLFKWTKLN